VAADVEVNADPAEAARSRCRTLIAQIDSELAELRARGSTDGTRDLATLIGAWTSLVGELDFGAEPVLRRCPHCKGSILAVATRCRYCMNRSPADGVKA
jgi:hypothetical protein